MPWCPKCKSEYREGITECADCKVALVEELETVTENPQMPELPQQMYEQLIQEQAQDLQENQQSQEQKKVRVYQNKSEKAEEFKSSGYMLMVMGILGITALVLMELHIIPIYLAAPGKYITYAVMGALFLIFVIMGISSFRSSKKYEIEAESEEELTEQIHNWVLEHVSKEEIVTLAEVDADMPEEMKYFQYLEILKQKIEMEFGEVDASYLDSQCEELYGRIFDGES